MSTVDKRVKLFYFYKFHIKALAFFLPVFSEHTSVCEQYRLVVTSRHQNLQSPSIASLVKY